MLPAWSDPVSAWTSLLISAGSVARLSARARKGGQTKWRACSGAPRRCSLRFATRCLAFRRRQLLPLVVLHAGAPAPLHEVQHGRHRAGEHGEEEELADLPALL